MTGGYCFLPQEVSSALVELFSTGSELTFPGIYKEVKEILSLGKFCLVRPVDVSSETGVSNAFTTVLPCVLNPGENAIVVSILFGDTIVAIYVNENDSLGILSQGG